MRMQTRVTTVVAIAAAFAAVATIAAQDVTLIARVPFAFTVGDATLPRDTYRLSPMVGHPEMLVLRGDWKGVIVRTQPERERGEETPLLRFHRYGDQYFLREVRLNGTARLDLPETRGERAAAERRADRGTVSPEIVSVAAEHR